MIGCCDYDVCGECHAIDLVTFRKFGRLLLCVWFVIVIMVHVWLLLCYRGQS